MSIGAIHLVIGLIYKQKKQERNYLDTGFSHLNRKIKLHKTLSLSSEPNCLLNSSGYFFKFDRNQKNLTKFVFGYLNSLSQQTLVWLRVKNFLNLPV